MRSKKGRKNERKEGRKKSRKKSIKKCIFNIVTLHPLLVNLVIDSTLKMCLSPIVNEMNESKIK